jgi:hypothetical protein
VDPCEDELAHLLVLQPPGRLLPKAVTATGEQLKRDGNGLRCRMQKLKNAE